MVAERLGQYIENKGYSFYEFENNLGVSRGSISKSVKQNKNIGAGVLENILTTYNDLNPEWLLTGKGEMLRSKKEASLPFNGKIAPLVDKEAVAGFGNTSFSISKTDIIDQYLIPEFNNVSFYMRVSGDSMMNKFRPGDIIACRIIHDPSFIYWNKPFLISTDSYGLILKRLKPGKTEDSYSCISDNPDYDPFQVPKDEIHGIALVLGKIELE